LEKAHTAEHILMASIKRIIPEASAIKVVHDEKGNTLYLRTPKLDWDILTEAVKAANRVIDEGREVKELFFENLDEAKKAIPRLRSYDERISGRVRVIEIVGYDYSACTRKHVSNTKECGCIFVTGFSKAGEDLYPIRFEVGEKAKEYAAETIALHMKVSEALGASQKTILQTATNLKREVEELRRRSAHLTRLLLEHLKPEEVGGVKLYAALYKEVERKALMDYAGEAIAKGRSVVLLVDKQKDAFFVLGRSKDLALDCGTLLKDVLQRFSGRGGGRAEFASGSASPEAAEQALTALKRRVLETLLKV
jgi:alanyl-tRNA synthetase